jgi:hypothetical protein
MGAFELFNWFMLFIPRVLGGTAMGQLGSSYSGRVPMGLFDSGRIHFA